MNLGTLQGLLPEISFIRMEGGPRKAAKNLHFSSASLLQSSAILRVGGVEQGDINLDGEKNAFIYRKLNLTET